LPSNVIYAKQEQKYTVRKWAQTTVIYKIHNGYPSYVRKIKLL